MERKTAFLDLAEATYRTESVSTIESPIREKPSSLVVESKQSSYRSLLLHRYNLLTSQQQRSPPMTQHPAIKYIFLRLRILLSRIIIQIIAQKQISVFSVSINYESKTIAIRATKDSQYLTHQRVLFLRSNQNQHIHSTSLHRLLFLRSTFPCLRAQILQRHFEFIFFDQPQNIIIKLQNIQHSQVYSDCYHPSRAFLYSEHSQRGTSARSAT